MLYDITGFTTLAERLARRGSEGAELLAEVVNEVLSTLLSEVHATDGDVIAFGGDALLVFHEGADHAPRAWTAAQRGLTAVRRFRRWDSPVGRLSVGVSAGGESGVVTFAASEIHRLEVAAVGPVVSAALANERDAGSGELRAGPTLQALLGNATLAEAEAMAVAPGTPVDAPMPEHRTVAIGFLNLSGTDRAPAVAADFLDVCAEAARARSVSVVGADADRDAVKVVLVAGAPMTDGHDADRLLQVADDVLTSMGHGCRAGLHHGRAFTGLVGDAVRATWTVYGDVVNTAARIMSHAAPGTLLASQAFADALRRPAVVGQSRSFAVKGRTAEVQAVEVRVGDHAHSPSPVTDELFGRDEELELVGRASRTPGVLQIVGPAGIGKTALVAHSLGDAHVHLRMEGAAYERDAPYMAVSRSLRRLVDAIDDAPTEQLHNIVAARAPRLLARLPLLADVFRIDVPDNDETRLIEAQFRPDAAIAAAVELIDALLPRAHRMIVVEDAHWLDDLSARFVGQVAARAEGLAVSLIVTRRDEGTTLDLAGTTYAVPALDEHAARRLLSGAALPPGTVEDLVARAAGNPLFLTALRATPEVLELPGSLQAVLTARLDALAPEPRDLLKTASVLGARPSLDLLSELTGQSTSTLARVLGSVELVAVDDRGLRFDHDLVRQAAYDSLPYRRRRLLHAAAAASLERDASADEAQLELLSLHHAAARNAEPAWRWSMRAARAAAARGAHREAAALFTRGLRFAAPDVDAEVQAQVELATSADRAGDVDVMSKAFDRACRIASQEDVADILTRRFRVLMDHRTASSARRCYTRARRAVDALPDGPRAAEIRAALELSLAGFEARRGRMREVDRICTGLVSRGVGGPEVIAGALYMKGWAVQHAGRLSEAVVHIERAIEIAGQADLHDVEATARSNLGTAYHHSARWDLALESYRGAVTLRRGIGDLVQCAVTEYNIGALLFEQGRLDEAERTFEEVLATFRGARFYVGEIAAMANLGEIQVWTGDPSGVGLVTDALALSTSLGRDLASVEMRASLARSLLAVGDLQAARTASTEARRDADRIGGSWGVALRRVEAQLAAAVLDHEVAAATLELGLLEARDGQWRFEELQTLHTYAVLLPDHAPADAAKESAAGFAQLGVVRTWPVRMPDGTLV